jgi:hypothetical protein
MHRTTRTTSWILLPLLMASGCEGMEGLEGVDGLPPSEAHNPPSAEGPSVAATPTSEVETLALPLTINKYFEFGAGTSYPHSNHRTFKVPAGEPVSATVEFERFGQPGAANDVPIYVELRQPGPTPDQEGPVVMTRYGTATTEKQTITVTGARSLLGCSLPWRVRVGYAQPGEAPKAVFGSIELNYDSDTRAVNVEGALITLDKGTEVTKKFGGSQGLGQGRVELRATWLHACFGIPCPGAVRLKFELLRPDGSVADSDSGFSYHEAASMDRLRLVYQVPEAIPGQWKIRLTNNTSDDVMNIDFDSSQAKRHFTPSCPN